MNIKVILKSEGGRRIEAHVPSLPGCVGCGMTEDEALKNVRGAILCHFGIEEVLHPKSSMDATAYEGLLTQIGGSKMSKEKKLATVVTLTGLSLMIAVIWTANLFASLLH